LPLARFLNILSPELFVDDFPAVDARETPRVSVTRLGGADTEMARFDRAGRDTPAGVLPEALPRHAPGVGISAEDAVRAYELERARRQRALGERSRWRFEEQASVGVSEKQSAFSRDRSRAYNETNGMSRWQARATYGDAGKNPVDGIWPPPLDPTRADVASSATTSSVDFNDDDANVVADPATADPESAEHLSRTALALRQRKEQFFASIASKGPRAPPEKGAHENRWQDRAGKKNDPTAGFARRPADAHAGRHEARAFFGDGGGKNKPIPQAEKDANGGASNEGRWEERGRWHDANVHLEMPNGGHYAPHMGRDAWENGGYLKLERGVHEAGYRDGVWDDGLWERRAGWAHAVPRGGARPKPGDPVPGPHGQRPIGPLNESRQLAGAWEARAEWHRDDNGHVARDVGALGHVRRGADAHAGRWEERAEWGKGRVHPKLEHKTSEHAGRWEERAQYHREADGVGAGAACGGEASVPGGPREPPAMRAARVAAANRDFVRFRDGLSNDGTENGFRENDLNRARGGKRGNDLKADGILREASVEEATTRPTWAGETPARNLGAEARSSSAVAVDRPDANETTNEKTNEREEDGAFAAWMEGKGARRGHTRTPSAYREGYDAANEKFGLRLNHGVARLCGNLEGDAVLPDHGLSNGGLSGGSMAAMRSAIASASRASAERRETARRHLGSRAGILS
jgi:hypothetical protein